MPSVNVNVAGLGDNALVAADGTVKMYPTGGVLVATGAVTVALRNVGDSANIIGPCALGAGGVLPLPYNPDGYGFGLGLKINLSAAVQVGGVLTYRRDRP